MTSVSRPNPVHCRIASSLSSRVACVPPFNTFFSTHVWELCVVCLGGNNTSISVDEFSIACGSGCPDSVETQSPTAGPAVETSDPARSPFDSTMDSPVPIPSEGSDSENTLIRAAAGSVAVLVSVALTALLAVLLRRRQDARTIVHPRRGPRATDNVDDDLEHNREKTQRHSPPYSAPYEEHSITGRGQSDSNSTAIATQDGVASFPNESADDSPAEQKSYASIDESDEGPDQRQERSDRSRASSAANRPRHPQGVGLGHAALAAAQELAPHCQVPLVSEAVAGVCVMANLVTDCQDIIVDSTARLKQCRSIKVILEQADKVAEEVGFVGV